MFNVSLALALVTSWMLNYIYFSHQLINILGLAAFQISLVLIPLLFWFAIFKTTSIWKRLRPTRLIHSLLVTGNIVAIFDLSLHVSYLYRTSLKVTLDEIVGRGILDHLALWARVLFPFGKLAILIGVSILLFKLASSFPTPQSAAPKK